MFSAASQVKRGKVGRSCLLSARKIVFFQKNFLRLSFFKQKRSYDLHKKTQKNFCPLSIATWWLSYSTKHRQGSFFQWKSSFFLETSNFQQPVRRNRNDGKTCTFSAWILCEVKKNVPRSLPNSMIWENLGQIFFSLNFCPFSETCVLNKVLRVTESISNLLSICAKDLWSQEKC